MNELRTTWAQEIISQHRSDKWTVNSIRADTNGEAARRENLTSEKERIMTGYFCDIVGHPLKSIGSLFKAASGYSRLALLDPDLRKEALEADAPELPGFDTSLICGGALGFVGGLATAVNLDPAGGIHSLVKGLLITFGSTTIVPLVCGQIYTAYMCSKQAKRNSGEEHTPSNLVPGNNPPAPL